MLRASRTILGGMLLLLSVLIVGLASSPRVIEVVADRDNKFKVPGKKDPVISLKVNEVVILRITSRKGPEWDKDGATHSFTVNALKDRGWDLRLFEGTKQFTLVAPAQPGEYLIECLVKCGKGHDDMNMKLVVTP